MKLLLVEDEKRMAEALVEILRMEHYDVEVFHDGLQGYLAVENDIYDVIILDVMLPGKSGFEIARHARNCNIKTPILMLTAKADVDDKVTGLDSGADDYLTKPFMTKELLARLRALTRRSMNQVDSCLSYGDIELNLETCMLTCISNGQSIRLKEKEFHIMEYFLANKEQVITRENLAMKIWGYENEAEYNNVEVYMTFTRKKLNYVGSKVEIKAVRGLGYELRCKDV